MGDAEAEKDLEKIAIEYATIMETHKIGDILRGLEYYVHADKSLVEMKNGIPYFKNDLKKEQKEALANKFEDYLIRHLIYKKYGGEKSGFDEEAFKKFRKLKIGDEYASDNLLEMQFGINGYELKKMVLGLHRVDSDALKEQFGKLVKHQVNKVSNDVLLRLKDFKAEQIRSFIKKTGETYGTPEEKEGINEILEGGAYTHDVLSNLYAQFASKYRPVKDKKK